MEEIQKNTKEVQSNMERIYSGTVRAVLFDMDNTLFDFVAAKLGAAGRSSSILQEKMKTLPKTRQSFSVIS